MSAASAPTRSLHALSERDVNIPAGASAAAQARDASQHSLKSAHDASLPAPMLAPGSSPSKSAAVERRQQQLTSSSPTINVTTASSPPAAPVIAFSEDAHAGLHPQDGQASSSANNRLVLYGSYTHTLVLGRSKPSGKPHVSSAATVAATDSNTSMSQTDALVRAEVEALYRHSPTMKGGLGSTVSGHASSPSANPKYMRVCLPNDARHVSRVHALLHYSPFPSVNTSADKARVSPTKIPTAMLGSFLLRIVGQNGLYVDGERLRADSIVTLVPGRTRLGFFSDVEAIFDVHSDAMPAHIRSRALELQSRLVPRTVAGARSGSPVKKKGKTAPSHASLLTLVRAAAQQASVKAPVSAASSASPTRQERRLKEPRPQPNLARHDAGPTPPPTSSPTRDSQTSSQDFVSQALRPVPADHSADLGALSPPPSSSPVTTHVDIDPMTGLRKRKHREVVAPSEDESSFGSDGDSDFGGGSAHSHQPQSSPAAAASRRRTADKAGQSPYKIKRAVMAIESEEEADEDEDEDDDSDSALSSASSLSDEEDLASPVRRPAKKAASSAPASDSQKKMPPPPLPVRSSVRQTLSAAASQNTRVPMASGNVPLNADPLAVARGLYLQAAARRSVAALAPSYDLEGVLVNVIVSHRTATMAASEAVRSVLNQTPGLMRGVLGPKSDKCEFLQDAAAVKTVGNDMVLSCFAFEHALANTPLVNGRKLMITATQWNTALTKGWREHLELVLRYYSAARPTESQGSAAEEMKEPCGPFGSIQRAGKDSAGNPLEPWYYYNPEADPDRSRATNLKGIVKPIRGALKVHKPIYWKKAAYGHNETDLAPGDEGDEGTTGVGGTSYLSRTVANEVWGTNVEWGLSGNEVAAPTAVMGAAGAGGNAAFALETQFNGLSESLVASSRFGYSTRPDPSSTPSSSTASIANSGLGAVANPSARGAPVQELENAPEGVTQRLVDRVWSETQEEEERETTWDKFGDMDWRE
ncbi:hypothetical protein OC835_001470 [Tilletia horrida]|nr:hypothetical protein OC835_001470 [Tilletia horrida]